LADAAGRAQRFIAVIEDITPRKQIEAALREETRVLELLNETGKTLASTLELTALVQAVTDASIELSGAQFGGFFHRTASNATSDVVRSTLSGEPREAFERLGPPLARGLFGQDFRVGTPVRCDDLLAYPDHNAGLVERGMPRKRPPLRSYMAVPVRSRSGEAIGGLFLGHLQPNAFTQRSERLIVGVAAQAGIAIDNARLYEAAQEAAEERKVLLDSERAARASAERLSDVKDEFLATLSHELRTPLNAILGWSQILRSGAKDQLDLMKGLETIERNARAQTQLIEDLLDMSRITSGKLRLDTQAIQPVSFIEAAVETVKPAADAKGIKLERHLDPSTGRILADPGRLQQVIWNLVSNAIKFTPKNGKVQIRLERVDAHVKIRVEDTGVGIRPEFIPHLFERFRQGDASTTRKYGGLGLGLSIVKSLVELHGGTVSVESLGEGRGTTVTVQLPLMAGDQPAEAPDPVQLERPHTSVATVGAGELAGIKVLVVDDQAEARDLMKRVLEDCAAVVTTAATANEAVRLVQSSRPDVLVSDIGMPDADGFELLKQVRALGPRRGGKVPAIALTAFARSEDRTRALRAGFLVHVSKPVDPSELVATVASVVGRMRPRSRWTKTAEAPGNGPAQVS
jgi:signal transduction histidine kinase/AmiR/NasT family two-component response regulator